MRIALVKSHVLSEPDPDEAPLLAALRERGCDACPLAWDDPGGPDLASFDVLTIRAAWNYHHQPDDFSAWLDNAESSARLVNDAETVRWNMHKSYLADLDRAGIETVPTAFFPHGATPFAERFLAERGWDDIVIKPAVSGGSRRTRRFMFSERDQAQAFLAELAATGDVMVQPYMPSVEQGGEVAIVWIAGEVTHVVEKAPRFDGEAESVRGRPATDAERKLASRVVAAGGRDVLYARVDVINDEQGKPLLSELELIEPSLFFQHGPGSVERFADALVAIVRAC